MIKFKCKLFCAQFMLSFLPTALGTQDDDRMKSLTGLKQSLEKNIFKLWQMLLYLLAQSLHSFHGSTVQYFIFLFWCHQINYLNNVIIWCRYSVARSLGTCPHLWLFLLTRLFHARLFLLEDYCMLFIESWPVLLKEKVAKVQELNYFQLIFTSAFTNYWSAKGNKEKLFIGGFLGYA